MENKGVLIKLLAIAILLSIASPAFAGGWMFYSDGPYKGKVLDLETGEPIEGAVVAGVWQVDQYGGLGGVIPTFCDARETLTDKNGEFEVPKASCAHWWPFSTLGSPQFTLFKPGYLGYPPLGATMEERTARMPGFTGLEFREKKTDIVIQLGKPKTWEERRFTYHTASSTFTPDDKSYIKMPILLKFVNDERKYLGFAGEIDPVRKGEQKNE